eukprot:Rmarinus@m.7407
MATNDQITLIVDKLNEPPFKLGLNCVAFDEKSPQALLQTLNDILAYLDDEHKIDLREENPEWTCWRMAQFLRVLKYKSNLSYEEFSQRLLQGDQDVIYPIMIWILTKLEDLKKRAYLARFLVDVDIPEEFFADQDIQTTFQTYKELQEQFKQAHRDAEIARKQTAIPKELREKLTSLEQERETLDNRNKMLKTRLQKESNFGPVFEVCRRLKVEQDEKKMHQKKYAEQMRLKAEAETKFAQVCERLTELEEEDRGMNAEQVLRKVEDEANEARHVAEVMLPQEIANKERRLQEVRQVLEKPRLNDSDITRIQNDLRAKKEELNQLIERQAQMQAEGGEALQIMQRQAVVVEERKETLVARYNKLLQEKDSVESELLEKTKQRGELMPRREELRRFGEDLRAKHEEYQRKQVQLAECQAEVQTLQQTKLILTEKWNRHKNLLERIEKRKGIQGYRDVAKNLEHVSEMTEGVNEEKARTLEELSALVDQITRESLAKKDKLYPLLKKHRELTAERPGKLQEHEQKKSLYDQTRLMLESELGKLREEVHGLHDGQLQAETMYHMVSTERKSLSLRKKKVEKEKVSRKEHTDKSYRDIYTERDTHLQKEKRSLKEKQQDIKENFESHKDQMEMFNGLVKLLRCKMDWYKSAQAADEGLTNAASIEGERYGAADRLILE